MKQLEAARYEQEIKMAQKEAEEEKVRRKQAYQRSVLSNKDLRCALEYRQSSEYEMMEMQRNTIQCGASGCLQRPCQAVPGLLWREARPTRLLTTRLIRNRSIILQ